MKKKLAIFDVLLTYIVVEIRFFQCGKRVECKENIKYFAMGGMWFFEARSQNQQWK